MADHAPDQDWPELDGDADGGAAEPAKAAAGQELAATETALEAQAHALEAQALGAQALEAQALEAGRLLFAAPCKFFFAAQRLDQLPPPGRTEIAFAGRSNVGKSSLINSLVGHHALARASHTPGRTRQLNFFDLGGRLVLVDMPGYGYAQAAKSVKEDWQGLMFEYLRGRPTLSRVMLLLDARIELKASDTTVMDLLDRAAVTYQCVLTKADDVKPRALEAKQAEILALTRKHPAAFPQVAVTSSNKGVGIEELRASLAALA